MSPHFERAVRLFLAVAMAIVWASSTAATYIYTDIAFPGATYTVAFGINEKNQIIGVYGPSIDNLIHGFVYSSGSYVTLDFPGASSTSPTAINKHGVIVGTYVASGTTRSFMYTGSLTSIDVSKFTTIHPMDDALVLGINDEGWLVGTYPQQFAFGTYVGFVYNPTTNGTTTVSLGQNTVVNGISNGNEITGIFGAPATAFYGAVGGPYVLFSGLPGVETIAYGLNQSGKIVGGYGDTTFYNGLLYDSSAGVLTTLNPPWSRTPGSRMTNNGINDAGVIVGNGDDALGNNRSFMAVPTNTSNMVYRPLEPCRIMDTRSATAGSGVQGPIAGNSLKTIPGFVASGSNWGQYGGSSSSDCGLTISPGTSIGAVALVATILSPDFDAYLGISDAPSLPSVLANVALNYTRGQGLSTMYIVPQLASNNIYFAMPTGLSAQIIFDVVGYDVVSDATTMQCTTQASAPVAIAAATSGNATSPACSAGYTLSSGSCDSTSFTLSLTQSKASGSNTTWLCAATNRGATSANLTATANCCRVPGR